MIRQLVLGRTEDLDAPGVAAFVSGWCAALELVRRSDLTVPGAPPGVHATIARVVTSIDEARREALGDDSADG
jgi:hypothetical protein